jgi:serine/threonine-protein kinase
VVVDTRPSAGTPLEPEATVQIIVSAGLPRVAVPDLVSLSLAEAQKDLERLGLRLGRVSRDSAALAAPGTVLGQSPSPGTVVERATRIRVTVATEPIGDSAADTASSG